MKFDIPRQIDKVMKKLNEAGHEVFVVGGCVRDVLMGKKPDDWDLCTSALPEEIKGCFDNETIIDIGSAYGTIAIATEKKPIEITTYRIDGEYFDNRHPENVVFARTIEEDLARRDFTINAMAYNRERGIVDLYGGRMDIRKQVIRCVGDPEKRFDEDALRILRGLRFAATLDFNITENTAKAMNGCKEGLKYIPIERINREFLKLVRGESASDVIKRYGEIIKVFAPELNENNTSLIGGRKNEDVVFLCTIFRGNVETTMRRLKFSKKIINDAVAVSSGENIIIEPDPISIKKLLREYELLVLEMMIDVKENYGEDMTACRELIDEIQSTNQCYSIGGLAIDGQQLIHAGFSPGPEIGEILNSLLDYVIEHPEANKKELLLDRALSEKSL